MRAAEPEPVLFGRHGMFAEHQCVLGIKVQAVRSCSVFSANPVGAVGTRRWCRRYGAGLPMRVRHTVHRLAQPCRHPTVDAAATSLGELHTHGTNTLGKATEIPIHQCDHQRTRWLDWYPGARLTFRRPQKYFRKPHQSHTCFTSRWVFYGPRRTTEHWLQRIPDARIPRWRQRHHQTRHGYVEGIDLCLKDDFSVDLTGQRLFWVPNPYLLHAAIPDVTFSYFPSCLTH